MICVNCPKQLSPVNKCGLCRPCLAKKLNSDPAIIARRKAAIQDYFERPGIRQAHAARLKHYLDTMSEEERKRRSDMALASYERLLLTPEVKAKATAARNRPEVRRRAGAARTRTRIPWCPPDLIPVYHDLTRRGGLHAHEARAAMQDMIPGTIEHARRTIANNIDVARIREERRRAQEY